MSLGKFAVAEQREHRHEAGDEQRPGHTGPCGTHEALEFGPPGGDEPLKGCELASGLLPLPLL